MTRSRESPSTNTGAGHGSRCSRRAGRGATDRPTAGRPARPRRSPRAPGPRARGAPRARRPGRSGPRRAARRPGACAGPPRARSPARSPIRRTVVVDRGGASRRGPRPAAADRLRDRVADRRERRAVPERRTAADQEPLGGQRVAELERRAGSCRSPAPPRRRARGMAPVLGQLELAAEQREHVLAIDERARGRSVRRCASRARAPRTSRSAPAFPFARRRTRRAVRRSPLPSARASPPRPAPGPPSRARRSATRCSPCRPTTVNPAASVDGATITSPEFTPACTSRQRRPRARPRSALGRGRARRGRRAPLARRRPRGRWARRTPP